MTSPSRSAGPSAYKWRAAPGIPPAKSGARAVDAYADHKAFLRGFMASDERCRETDTGGVMNADRLAGKLRQAASFLGLADRVRVAVRRQVVYVEKVA